MKKTLSIKQNHEFRRLYYRGKSAGSRHLVLYCRRNRRGQNRLGLTVSAKLGGAVVRNRIKRLLREAYRLNRQKFGDGLDLVIVARSRMVGAAYKDVEQSLLRALAELPEAAAKS